MPFFVYIIRTDQNKLYIGHSNDLNRRETEHARYSQGAKFIKDNGRKFQLVYNEQYPDRKSAMARERQLKRWTRAKKEALIAGDIELLKRL